MNPKQTENKYQRSSIYKIISSNCDEIYVGSTCENLRKRLGQHVANYKYYLNNNQSNYVTSFKIIENGNYDIILLEKYPCNDKTELHSRERHWIENTPNCINKILPTRTRSEYYRYNKDQIILKAKDYSIINQEQIKNRMKKYHVINKTKLNIKSNEYYQKNKTKCLSQAKENYQNNKAVQLQNKKGYYNKNKDTIIEKSKTYYLLNKLKIEQKRNQKIACICGSEIKLGGRYQHNKSEKHLNHPTIFLQNAERELEELNQLISTF